MTSTDWLMAAKVLILVAAGVAFAWWQFHDLAQEKRRNQERESQNGAAKSNADN